MKITINGVAVDLATAAIDISFPAAVVAPPAPVPAPAPAPSPAPSPAPAPSWTLKAAFNSSVQAGVLYINDFTAGAVSEHWDFGDGTTSDVMGSQKHTYTESGIFAIMLTAKAANGTTSTSTVHDGVIVPLPAVIPPAVSVVGQPVTVVANLTLPVPYTATLTLAPGDVKPLDPTDPSKGAAVYYADGLCVCLENSYEKTTGDIRGHFTVTAGATALYDGTLTLWAHGGTRSFWLAQPQPVANPDLSFMPKLGAGSEKASSVAWYAAGDNGPTGAGNIILAIGTGGEHPHLGPVPEWDAAYLTNPNADNLAVVRGMADSLAVLPFHVRCFATGKMLSVADYPAASMLPVQLGVGKNPIAKFTTNCPIQLDQGQAHATNYSALACALYDTDFDREQLAMWCNWVNSLCENYTYRSKLGCCTFRDAAGRGFGRGLNVLIYAAKYASPEYAPQFQAWVDEAAADGAAAWLAQTGIQIMQQGGPLVSNVNAYANGGYAPWMQDILTNAIGRAIQLGHTAFQPILDYFSVSTFERVEADHEFATLYNSITTMADGTPVATWAEGLQRAATFDPKLAAGLALPEGSLERLTTYGETLGYLAGDFVNFPTSPTGYAAMYQSALAVCVRYATDQPRAQAAWAKFKQYQRIDFSQNGKYNETP
ncbi:MAG: hypothetical protein B7Z66_15940 [Chromatiales bacterium 21-64-14]|nr:MAG: hypothetical protein B7Z66_15940 [Chromatiales bacterium 21-64-14]